MDYADRLSEIFGPGKGPTSLRVIFDCESTQWTMMKTEKKVFFLEKMIASGYPLESWINDYKEEYKKTHPHIMKAIDKSIAFLLSKTNLATTISTLLEKYIPKIDNYLNKYSDFEKLDLSQLDLIGFKYPANDRGLQFVDKLRTHLNENNIQDDNYIIKFWIINKWGGIASFKDNFEKPENNNRAKIDTFIQKINLKKELTKPVFEVISSLSKVASFNNHEDFFVYDSRVVYALNWLLLKANVAEGRFFPMPQGRNAKLACFDLDTIIKLKYKNNFENLEFQKLYYSYKDAYYIYCNLIKDLAKILIPDRKPYHLEMLLFSLTDEVYGEIRNSVNISIS